MTPAITLFLLPCKGRNLPGVRRASSTEAAGHLQQAALIEYRPIRSAASMKAAPSCECTPRSMNFSGDDLVRPPDVNRSRSTDMGNTGFRKPPPRVLGAAGGILAANAMERYMKRHDRCGAMVRMDGGYLRAVLPSGTPAIAVGRCVVSGAL